MTVVAARAPSLAGARAQHFDGAGHPDPALMIDGGSVGRLFPLGKLQGDKPPLFAPPAPFVDVDGNPWAVITFPYDPASWIWSSSGPLGVRLTFEGGAWLEWQKARDSVYAAMGWAQQNRITGLIPTGGPPVVVWNGTDQASNVWNGDPGPSFFNTSSGLVLTDRDHFPQPFDNGNPVVSGVRLQLPDVVKAAFKSNGLVTHEKDLYLVVTVDRWARVAVITGGNWKVDISPTSSIEATGKIFSAMFQGGSEGEKEGSAGGPWGTIIGVIVGVASGLFAGLYSLGRGSLDAARLFAEGIAEEKPEQRDQATAVVAGKSTRGETPVGHFGFHAPPPKNPPASPPPGPAQPGGGGVGLLLLAIVVVLVLS